MPAALLLTSIALRAQTTTQPPLRLVREIGVNAAVADAEFQRPGAIAVDGDGRIFVAERGDQTIKVFSRDGQYLKRFGQSGQGPGDFASIMRIDVNGRTVSVQDGMARRLTDFDTDGKLIGTRRLPPAPGNRPAMTYPLRHDHALAVSVAAMNSNGPSVSDPFSVGVLIKPGGRTIDTLFRFQSDMAFWRPKASQLWNAITSGFGDGGAWAIHGDSLLAVANGMDGSVRWYRADATGLSLIRQASLGNTPVPLTASDSASLMQRFRAEHTQPRYANMDVVFAGYPAFRSRAASALFSSEGDLWIGNAPSSGTAARWVSFASTQTTPRVVTLPVGFTLRAVRNGLLYGTAINDDDIPVVRVYALPAR